MSAEVWGEPAPPVADPCPACGAPMEPDQEWCLECGAARTNLCGPPSWWIAIAIVAAVLVSVVIVLALALP